MKLFGHRQSLAAYQAETREMTGKALDGLEGIAVQVVAEHNRLIVLEADNAALRAVLRRLLAGDEAAIGEARRLLDSTV